MDRTLVAVQTNSRISLTDYARPQTLDQALSLLAGGGWKVLGGGTDLYPNAGTRLAGRVLDLTAVAGLSGITVDDDLRIGAATTWADLAAADLPPACRALQQASLLVGGRQVQNAGTIGGNLCNASPAADGVPALVVLDAVIELCSGQGMRRLDLDAFLLGPRQTALQPGEIVSAVIIPKASLRGRSAFVKLGARAHLVISIAMVAARLEVDSGRIMSAAIAVGSCSPVAARLALVEAALTGAPVAEAMDRVRAVDVHAALAPIDDVRATADYRRQAAVELVRHAVAAALA